MSALRVVEPSSSEQFESYYSLRYEVLRKPWKQPLGSERDESENEAVHAAIYHESGKCIAAGRLQKNNHLTGQIRFMAVDNNYRGLGLGKLIVGYLEQKAREMGLNCIILQARENAVPFYEAMNYSVKEKTFLLFGEIQHYLMEKSLA